MDGIKSSVDNINNSDVLNAVGYIVFGSDYQGVWSAGAYSVGQYTLQGQVYYRCLVARMLTDTDDPSVDNTGWEVADSYISQSDFSALMSGVSTAIKDTYKANVSALSHATYGLPAIKNLIDDIPTDNSLSQTDFNTLMDGVSDSIKADYKANVSSIPTDNSISQNTFDGLMSGVSGGIKDTYKANVSSIPTDNSISQSVFNNLMDGVTDAIKNAYKANVSSIPTTVQIATAVAGIEILTSVDLKRTLQTMLASLGTASVNAGTNEVTYSDPVSGGVDRLRHSIGVPDGTRTGELL